MVVSNQLDIFALAEADTPLDPNIVEFGSPLWDTTIFEWQTSSYFGFDIETYGDAPQDGLNPWLGYIRLIQIGLPSGKVLVVDLGGYEDDRDLRHKQLKAAGWFDVLRERLAHPKVKVIGQNLKFDCQFVLAKYGMKVRGARDTMLMSQLYWAGLPSGGKAKDKMRKLRLTGQPYQHSLKAIAQRVLGVEVDKSQQSSAWGWGLTNAQKNYAAKDAQIVLDIAKKLGKWLVDEDLRFQAEIEAYCVPIFAEMEFKGMPVCTETLQRTIKQYRDVEAQILADFYEAFPKLPPTASSPVLKKAIAEKYNRQLEDTSADTLAYHQDLPAIKSLSVWRSFKKSLDYLLSIRNTMFDGCVRGNYQQMAPTGFGRSACGNSPEEGGKGINLQNPPNGVDGDLKKYGLPPVRVVFKVPQGKKLIVSDLSAAHAKIAIEASQDPVLVEVSLADKDIHCVTASKLAALQGLHWTPDEIHQRVENKSHPDHSTAKLLRTIAKPNFYGSLNMQGGSTLQATIKTQAGVQLSLEQAQEAVQTWRKLYAGLYHFQRCINDRANRQKRKQFEQISGEWVELRGLSNRRIYMLLDKYRDNDTPKVKATDAVAHYWTSTEADIVKLAMLRIQEHIDQHPEWGAWIGNIAHDELDVICEEAFADEVAKIVDGELQGAMKLFVKSIPVVGSDYKYQNSIVDCWADKK